MFLHVTKNNKLNYNIEKNARRRNRMGEWGKRVRRGRVVGV
jgi:hypothetical protein